MSASFEVISFKIGRAGAIEFVMEIKFVRDVLAVTLLLSIYKEYDLVPQAQPETG